jgi:hypothetical protein
MGRHTEKIFCLFYPFGITLFLVIALNFDDSRMTSNSNFLLGFMSVFTVQLCGVEGKVDHGTKLIPNKW